MRRAPIGLLVLSLVALAAAPRSVAQPPDAGTPPREGTVGDCTITLQHGQFWRSAQMVTMPHMPHDGFGWMNVGVTAHIACTTDSTIRIAGAWTLMGTRRRPLHHPDQVIARVMEEWDGHVAAGTPLDVEWLWHDGPPAGQDALVGAVVRFRTASSPRTIELAIPPMGVTFVS